MTAFLQVLQTLSEQMKADMSRSDVLRALVLPIGVLILGILGAVTAHAADWLLIVLVALLAAFIIVYTFTYMFCLFFDRDALRSEKYSLQKMAIEHRLYGDSGLGLINPNSPPPALPPSPSDKTEG